jgi:cytoplasmic iron level regulating protein YaaA (DUF328/UPF0246 family)
MKETNFQKIEIPNLEEKRASFSFRGDVFEYTCPNELKKKTEKTFQDLNGILFLI